MIPRSQAGRIDVLELEAELADVVAETGFDVARLVKATFHELRDACLGRKALHRIDKNIPLRRYVCVGGQTGDVHEALGVDDGSLVEGRDAPGEGIAKAIEIDVRQCAVDVAVAPCQPPPDVARPPPPPPPPA